MKTIRVLAVSFVALLAAGGAYSLWPAGASTVPAAMSQNLHNHSVASPTRLSARVDFAADPQQVHAVRVTRVERRALTQTLPTLGRVAVDETRDFRITAAGDGWVGSIAPDATTGSTVREGQPLMTVNGRDYSAVQRAFLYALRSFEAAGKSAQVADGFGQQPSVLLEEARLDLKRFGFGDAQIDAIRARRDVQLDVVLPAPAVGVVIDRRVLAHQQFMKGDELVRIADLRHVWIMADLSADDASRLHPNDAVAVSIPDRPTMAARRAKVSQALPLFNGDSRTLKIRLEIDNPDFALRPDMFVNLEFHVEMPDAITVAAEAIRDTGIHRTVFVRRVNGTYEARSVETGWRVGDRVQIVKGLTIGELVVESGNFLLDSESRQQLTGSQGHD